VRVDESRGTTYHVVKRPQLLWLSGLTKQKLNSNSDLEKGILAGKSAGTLHNLQLLLSKLIVRPHGALFPKVLCRSSSAASIHVRDGIWYGYKIERMV